MQRRLAALNPDVPPPARLEHAELRPDGDAVVERWSDFVLAGCERCGGPLKPDVVFFGESVPRERVERAYAYVDAADVLVVLGLVAHRDVRAALRPAQRQGRPARRDHHPRSDPGRRAGHREDRGGLLGDPGRAGVTLP